MTRLIQFLYHSAVRWHKSHYVPWFSRLSHYKQHLLMGFLMGLAIETIVHFAHGVPLVASWQRWAQDKTIVLTQLYQAHGIFDRASLPAGFSRLVWVDVDDESWQNSRWGGGEPFPQPRAEIFQLIDKAFEGGACLVYLDIFLDGPAQQGDEKWLHDLSTRHRQKPSSSCPQRFLLTARSIRHKFDGSDVELRQAFWDAYSLPSLHESDIHVIPVVPYFKVDADLLERTWIIGQELKNPDHSTSFYASPQLAIYCIQKDWPGGKKFPSLDEYCTRHSSQTAHAHHAESTDHDQLSSTVLLPYPAKNSGLINASADHGYVTLPAISVLAANTPIHEFEHALVSIGTSFRESGDLHHTAAGPMPGGVFNINAIATMLQHGQLHGLAWWIKWPLALLVIGVVAAIFALGNRLLAVIGATAVVFGTFAFLVGPWLLLHGLWFDFGAPMIGIQLHRLIEEYQDRQDLKRLRNLYQKGYLIDM